MQFYGCNLSMLVHKATKLARGCFTTHKRSATQDTNWFCPRTLVLQADQIIRMGIGMFLIIMSQIITKPNWLPNLQCFCDSQDMEPVRLTRKEGCS